MNNRGIPPGSGAAPLMLCGASDCPTISHAVPHTWEKACDMEPICAHIGVRFPANDPDPGRFYRNDTLYRCTVCGRVGSVGRCCGDETRELIQEVEP